MSTKNTTEESPSIAWSLTKLLAQIVYGIFIFAYEAWALTLVWAWLIVPATGLAPLSMTLAIGIWLIRCYVVTTPASWQIGLTWADLYLSSKNFAPSTVAFLSTAMMLLIPTGTILAAGFWHVLAWGWVF